MIAEIGHYALLLALAVALVQAIVPLWGAQARDESLMAVAPSAAILQALLVSLSFAALVTGYVVSDFSILNVQQNSHSDQPLIYRITSTWGNHEGSMLLWALILALFGGLVAIFGRDLPATLKANALAVQSLIAAAFLSFIALTSNPFARLDPAPFEGRDLNPVLQDLGLAIHPPLLYIGYVGFSVTFSFAAAALIEGRIDAAWARWVRPWTLTAWIFLTLGIAMGSYWAYYELGWGGFWFWDPVENASLMPWIAGTALLHSAIVMERREALKVWTIFLAILAFSLSLLGTFLVRSGVLTSVHAFATDPARGVFILSILVAFIGGAFALYAWRAPSLKQGGLFAPISREGALVLNNLFLSAATAAVFVGTLYPLLLEATTGEKISVGPPFFNATFGPILLPVLLTMPLGPLLAWKRGDALAAMQRLWWAGAGGVAVALLVGAALYGGHVLAAAGIGFAAYLILGAFAEIVERCGGFRLAPGLAWKRLTGLPRSVFGTALGHAGIGLTLLGIVAASAFEQELVVSVKPGAQVPFAGYTLTFDGVVPRQGPNYTETAARFSVRSGGVTVATLEPAKRLYTARASQTTEAGIKTFGLSQLYLSLGDVGPDGGLALRAHYKPLVLLIWIGAVVMAAGGLVSLADRRLRVGVARRARPAKAAAA